MYIRFISALTTARIPTEQTTTPIVASCAFIIAIGLFYLCTAPVKAQNDVYGAAALVGPSLEPCVTEATTANATVVSPTDNWQQLLVNAKPGATILFRAGTYQSQDKLWLPAGAADQFITIKPYNCEQVTLYTSLRPLSYTIISGLTIEATGVNDSNYVIRIDSEYKGQYWGNITQVFIRNNMIRGGKTDAIRISDDSTHVTITGNHVDGGGTGHNIFVTSEKLLQRPDQIFITNNQLTKTFFTTAAEDMFQVRDVGYVAFTYNTCTNGLTMEECVDIKTTTQPLLIAHNFFDGEHLHQLGDGEDGASGCMVIHEKDGAADQHIIEHNYFNHCKDAAIRFASGSEEGLTSSGLVRYNLFFQNSYHEGEIPVVRAQNLSFQHNTIICGRFKLGKGDGSRQPTNTAIKNNIFYKTQIEDNTLPTYPYTCTNNLLYATGDSGFTGSGCTNTVAQDPQFAAVVAADFRLQATSPALYAGDDQNHLGALAQVEPLTQSTPNLELPPRAYLPLIRQTNVPLEVSCTP